MTLVGTTVGRIRIMEPLGAVPVTGIDPDLATLINRLKSLSPEARPSAVETALGDRQRAEPLYERVAAIQETVAIILVDLGDLYTRQGRYQEAEERYLRSLTSTEADSRLGRSRLAATQVGLGELYLAMGDAEQAAESWTHAVAVIEPLTAGSDVVEHLDTHAQALLYLDRVDEARPAAAKLLAKGWSDPDFLQLCRDHGLSALLEHPRSPLFSTG
ncbi:MAG: tetratricopeptide repeat protein [bacterium]|nr:tetratricopeptide repeat protein [bacterium]